MTCFKAWLATIATLLALSASLMQFYMGRFWSGLGCLVIGVVAGFQSDYLWKQVNGEDK